MREHKTYLLYKLMRDRIKLSIKILCFFLLTFCLNACKKNNTAETKFFSIIFPSNSEILMQCHKYVIMWEDNIEGDVFINLLKNDKIHRVITRSTQNDGKFNWYIQNLDELIGSNCFKIQVGSISDASVKGQSTSNFTVVNDTTPYARRIEVISPNGGEVWNSTLTHNIIIEKNFEENVDLFIYIGVNQQGQLINISGNDTIIVSCNYWPNSLNYKVKVSNTLYPDVFDFSDECFEISGGGKKR